MSYGNDDRDKDYYHDLDRRDDDREADRRQEDFIEDMKRDKERNDRDTDDAMAAIQRGDLVSAALRLGMSDSTVYLLESQDRSTDFAVDHKQSQADRSAEAQSIAVELGLLKQIASFPESELSELLNILHDQSLSVADRVLVTYTTAGNQLHEEIGQVFLTVLQLNAGDAKKFSGEMPKFNYLTKTRREFLDALLATINQLREQEKADLTRTISSELESK